MKNTETTAHKGRAIAVNVIMWLTAAAVCWMQFVGMDTFGTRIVAFIAILGTLVVWAAAGLLRVPIRRTWPHALGSVLVLVSVLLFNLPMRVSFGVVRGTMDGLADGIESGEVFDAPFRVGPHRIEKGEAWGEMQCFWTDATVGDMAGYCRLREGDPAEHINEWSIAPLGGGWYHVVED